MRKQLHRAIARSSLFLSTRFPERRILIESPNGVRSLKFGTREQLMGLASAAMIAGWLTVAAATGSGNTAEQRTEAELTRKAAQVQALKADSAALRGSVATAAQRIEARQQFLDAIITGRTNGADLAELLPPGGNSKSRDASVSGVLAPFAALEQKQNAMMRKVAATAEARLRDAEGLIGRLGLSPDRFIRQTAVNIPASPLAAAGATGMGGPYVPDASAGGDSDSSGTGTGTDPRFTELFVNWQRVEQLESAITSLPSFVPLRGYRLSSSFGVRSDPFNGKKARHTGLDMAGTKGQPIYAAAAGKVVRAGRFGGYGNCIDIDHGNGVITRYGHLSTIGVKVGQKVAMGEKIAGMGSTGRSTGNHLHYEVRIDGRSVNPLPFIEASSYLLAFNNPGAAANPAPAL